MLGFLPKKKDVKPKMPDIRGGNNKVDGYGKPKVVKPTTTTPSWGPQSVKGTTQPNFVTGSGKINQAIATGKGQPWMVKLDSVSGSKPQSPQPPKPPATPAGQMQIPGTSTAAQNLRNITRNPNLGLPGNRSGFSVGDLDSERLARQLTGQQAPKPWWDGSSRPRVRGTRPSVRTPGSPAPVPAWNQTPRSTSGATRIPRTNANTRPVQPQAPVPAWTSQGRALNTPKNIPSASGVDAGAVARSTLGGSKPTSLFSRIKGIRGGLASTALNMAAGGALDKYVVEPAGKALGDAFARTVFDVTGYGEKARKIHPSLYGKHGPDLTPDIVRGIRQRDKLAQQRAETQAASQPKPQQTGERSAAANAAKQEIAKAEAQRRRVSAADFDRTFAAARAKLEQQGKDPNSGTFPWRGKTYSTKLK